VAPFIVDALEAIQIKRRDRDRSALALRVGEFDRRAFIEPTTIQQPGQQVGSRLAAKPAEQQRVTAFQEEHNHRTRVEPHVLQRRVHLTCIGI
jgi:hypothetical protein